MSQRKGSGDGGGGEEKSEPKAKSRHNCYVSTAFNVNSCQLSVAINNGGVSKTPEQIFYSNSSLAGESSHPRYDSFKVSAE
jgi:hypothetical protein